MYLMKILGIMEIQQVGKGQRPFPCRKGVTLVITIADALGLMIAFASLIVAVIAVTKGKE